MQKVESAQLAYVRFKKLPIGHVFIVFRYTDGQEIALSPQAEFRDGEPFSLVRGFFKSYHLRYYRWEPAALVRKYTEQGRQVTVCTLALSRKKLTLLNRRMHERALKLEAQPEWYNPLFNSCVNSITDHLDEVLNRTRFLPAVLFIFSPQRLCRL